MMNLFSKSWLKKGLLLSILVWLNNFARASTEGSDMPFVSTTQQIKDAISGPWLMAAAIIMVVITCLMLAFGEFGDGFKKIINIVLWLSVAFGVTSFLTSLFGGGALC